MRSACATNGHRDQWGIQNCKFRKHVLRIYHTSPTLLSGNDYRMRLRSQRKTGGYIAQLVQWLGYEREDREVHKLSVIGKRMSMESWWSDVLRGKPNSMEKACLSVTFLHHKSHTVWHETKFGPKPNRLKPTDRSERVVEFYEYNAK